MTREPETPAVPMLDSGSVPPVPASGPARVQPAGMPGLQEAPSTSPGDQRPRAPPGQGTVSTALPPQAIPVPQHEQAVPSGGSAAHDAEPPTPLAADVAYSQLERTSGAGLSVPPGARDVPQGEEAVPSQGGAGQGPGPPTPLSGEVQVEPSGAASSVPPAAHDVPLPPQPVSDVVEFENTRDTRPTRTPLQRHSAGTAAVQETPQLFPAPVSAFALAAKSEIEPFTPAPRLHGSPSAPSPGSVVGPGVPGSPAGTPAGTPHASIQSSGRLSSGLRWSMRLPSLENAKWPLPRRSTATGPVVTPELTADQKLVQDVFRAWRQSAEALHMSRIEEYNRLEVQGTAR